MARGDSAELQMKAPQVEADADAGRRGRRERRQRRLRAHGEVALDGRPAQADARRREEREADEAGEPRGDG